MQAAKITDDLFSRFYDTALARMHVGLFAGSQLIICKLHLRQQSFCHALHVVEVHAVLAAGPGQLIAAAAHHRADHPAFFRMFGQRQRLGQVHPAHFENLHAFRLPGQIIGRRVQQAGQHSGAHHAELVADGVHQSDYVAAGVVCFQHHLIHKRRMDEGIGHHFVQTGRSQIIFRFALHFFHRVFLTLTQGQFRIVTFNFIVGMHAGDFLGNIRITGHILPPGRSRNYQRSVVFLHVKLETLQNLYHFLFGNIHADTGVDGFRRYGNHCGMIGHRVRVRNTADRFAGSHFFQQMRRPVQRAMAVGNVHAPFETHGGFTAQTQRFGGAPDRRAVESCRFQNNGFGLIRYFGDQTAHDAAQAHGLFRIRDGDHVRRQFPILVVQSLQVFPCFAPAHNEGLTGQRVVIIGVHGLSQFHHHIVGHVNHIADGTHTAGAQFILHPVRRGHNLDIFQRAAGETAAQFRNFNGNTQHVVNVAAGRFLYAGVRHAHRFTQHCRRFPGNARHAEAILFIGGEVNVQHRIVEAQHLFNVLADGCIRRKDQDPFPLFRQQQLVVNAKFRRAAQHSVRIHVGHLYFFQFHAVGQFRAQRSHRNDVPQLHILGPGLDLHDLAAAVIHLAHPQVIAFGILLNGSNLTGHHAGDPLSLMNHAFHFQPYAGQLVSQFFGSYININIAL